MTVRKILAAALAAAALALPANAPAAPRVALIQPGAQVETSVGRCTLNFVFTTSTKKYIGTAGHCVAKVGDTAWTLSPKRDIGAVVYRENQAAPGIDFALIEIDPNRYAEVEPAVRTYGGPTSVTSPADTDTGDVLLVTGYGLVFGSTSATRDRAGVLLSDNSNEYVADMIAVNGDSGGPVLHAETGMALGTVSRFNLPASTDIGPTVARILTKLRANGFSSIQIATAPYEF